MTTWNQKPGDNVERHRSRQPPGCGRPAVARRPNDAAGAQAWGPRFRLRFPVWLSGGGVRAPTNNRARPGS
eukprot:14492139-Alexandrium_andersonii.AAC.1